VNLLKSTFLLGILAIGLNAYAGAGAAGCGLGSLIFPKNSKFSQTFAMTTNSSYLTQFFGITSGTSNCSASSWVKNETEIENFVASNIHDIKVEMARGSGENLETLAIMMGCEPGGITDFSRASAKQFSEIFPSSQTSSQDAYRNLKFNLSRYPTVAKACQLPITG
jgi:hypothetical protein